MAKTKQKQGNPLASVLLNVVVPVVILTIFSKEKYLGPLWGLIIALVFPIGYGLRTLIRERKCDMLSIIGVVSVFLTGIFGVLKLPPQWIACKEAAVPFGIGLAVIISLKTPYPLIKSILMNDQIFDVDLLHARLREKGTEMLFEKRLVWLTFGLASSLFLSSMLNYVLAKVLLKSEPGTEAFMAELGKMTGLSYPVIVVPSMIVMGFVFWGLVRTLNSLTGLKMEDMLVAEHKPVETEEGAET